MNFAHFCEFWCFSLGKQARFTLNFCSGMPLRKVHELAFFWFGLPGPLPSLGTHFPTLFATLGPKGPNDSCSRSKESQHKRFLAPLTRQLSQGAPHLSEEKNRTNWRLYCSHRQVLFVLGAGLVHQGRCVPPQAFTFVAFSFVSENSISPWLSEIPCWKSFPANFDAAGKFFTDFRQHELLSPPRSGDSGHFLAKKMAAGKWAPPSGTLLDFPPLRPPQPS